MERANSSYQKNLHQIENLISSALEEWPDLKETDLTSVPKSESTLDSWDYCYSIAIGMAGVFIATSEAFGQYLTKIHDAASGNSGDYDMLQSFLGSALYHEGDHIDAIKMPFKNRNGGNAYCLFHRLLWGHDIFSIKGDNPFALMFNQKGLSGILQAVQHLLADTASKQGLPLPGSSFLDIVSEDNKTSNYLIKLAQQLSEETTGTKASAQMIYSHMMTIRAQDITAGSVVKLVSELYFRIRKIDDNIRRSEILLIAYTVNFLGEAVVGCFRQKGVPYINIPLAGAMATSFAQFSYYSHQKTKKLISAADALHAKVVALEKEQPILSLPVIENSDEFISIYEAMENNANELLEFWGGNVS